MTTTAVRRCSLGVGLIGMLLVLLPASPASGHAIYRSSNPSNGARLGRAPAAVVVTYTEPPDLRLSWLAVADQDNQPIVPQGAARPVPGRDHALQVPLPPKLPAGVYTVSWQVVSETDGHRTPGRLVFAVGLDTAAAFPVAGPDTATPGPQPWTLVGRTLFSLGLFILAGAVGTGLAVFSGSLPEAGSRWLLALGGVVAAAGVLSMTFGLAADVDQTVTDVGASVVGRWMLARLGGALACGAAAWWLARRPTTARLAALGVAVAATVAVHVLAGHAAAPDPTRLLELTAQWVHILAAGVWVGGLGWLLVGLTTSVEASRREVGLRFSRLAVWTAMVVIATGTIRALDEVGGWAQLWSSGYGQTLATKAGIVGLVMLGIGVLNRQWAVPHLLRTGDAGPLALHVRVEVALGAVVLALSALLSSLAPAASQPPSQAPAPTVLATEGDDYGTTVRVKVQVSPGTVGPNRFTAQVLDYDTGQPAAAARRVRLQFLPELAEVGTAPATVTLIQAPDGTWVGHGLALSQGGRWTAAAVVDGSFGAVDVPLDEPLTVFQGK